MLLGSAVRHSLVREYGFELQLCAALEDGKRLVARQLGAHVHGRRVMDVVLLSPGPNFGDRAAITPDTIPPRAIESDVGPGRATPLREAFDCHPETARETLEAAVEAASSNGLAAGASRPSARPRAIPTSGSTGSSASSASPISVAPAPSRRRS